jgi:hypothetical protein
LAIFCPRNLSRDSYVGFKLECRGQGRRELKVTFLGSWDPAFTAGFFVCGVATGTEPGWKARYAFSDGPIVVAAAAIGMGFTALQ